MPTRIEAASTTGLVKTTDLAQSSGSSLVSQDGKVVRLGTNGGVSDTINPLYVRSAHLGGTAAANLLDDYEEGTWTPTFACSVAANLVVNTYNNQVGRYVKIGNMVFCRFSLGTTSISFPNGQVDNNSSHRVQIHGLPFTTGNNSLMSGGSVQLFSSFGSVSTGINLGVFANSTIVMLRNQGDTSSYNGNYLDDVYTANMRSHTSGEGNMIHGFINYEV